MLGKINTASLVGLEAEKTKVEVDISAGLPNLMIVGLPNNAIRESKERIRAAIINSDLKYPSKRITINLSPANTKKEGTHYDLPIAIGLLVASGLLKQKKLVGYGFIGELSLDGEVNPISGALPLVIGLRKAGIRNIVLPLKNIKEAEAVRDVNLFPVTNLLSLYEHFNGKILMNVYEKSEKEVKEDILCDEDFSEVCGQDSVKRALQIAAAAWHNVIMIGPPGAGKTMMAKRLPGILPPLTYEEQLEVTKIYSIAGLVSEKNPIITQRPFRAPHHSVSSIALVGGGTHITPGEVSLAHYGVLFLDELPEFKRSSIEMLRQPIEDEKVVISRVSGTSVFPANFMLVLSMNPCPCGYYGDDIHDCTCTPGQIQHYLSKLSSPVLDRIDLQMEIFPVKYKELTGEKLGKSSSQMREEINSARDIQIMRYKKEKISYNSQMSGLHIKKYCKLNKESEELLEAAFLKLGLSARAHSRIIKLSRTIADMEGCEEIKTNHVAEAIRYRMLDKKFKL